MNVKPLYHRFLSEVWAVTEAGCLEFATRFSYEVPANVRHKAQDQEDGEIEDLFGKKLISTQMWGDTAIVSICGVMISGAGFLENLFGGVSHAQIEQAVVMAAARNPRAIVLDWNSPGGTVSGTSELASVVGDVAARVPTYSFCGSGLCASAAYWTGCMASSGFHATPSSLIGSIGCLMQSASIARLLENAGIDVRTFASAPFKATGNPTMKMTDDQAGYLQSLTNEIGADFAGAVRASRPGVSDSALDGRLFSTKQAQAMGLIDGQVSSMASLVDAIQRDPAPKTPPYPKEPTDEENEETLDRIGERKKKKDKESGFPNKDNPIIPKKSMSDLQIETAWRNSPQLRREFSTAKSYAAFVRAQGRGAVPQFKTSASAPALPNST